MDNLCSKTRGLRIFQGRPVSQWHEAIGDPTFADAILDRLIHNAYRVDLKGESMRERLEKETAD